MDINSGGDDYKECGNMFSLTHMETRIGLGGGGKGMKHSQN